ncbi:hypothetical protein [Mucilaginibacter celer]|uniref:Uncharacterized protein n=1 Tax=Mucilaginibacter celer TaxID=2305508 RepID=A0A494W3J9_9SPHI|nr:hypothetical protein [Mucilaginibacter celer]AYL97892.1 hypothetical protein HYN43_022485 [Mucilaginibacter celer]
MPPNQLKPFLKSIIVLVVSLILNGSCTNGSTINNKVPRISTSSPTAKQPKKGSDLTDSAKLVKLLRNLPIPKFPFDTKNPSSDPGPIDLSIFKDKKLMGLKLNLRERQIGGSIIDGDDIPSTFDLTDSTYKSNWLLIAMKPNFFVVITEETLVTLTYKLHVIDAMHIKADDPAGNSHFGGALNTTIYKDLTLKLNYYYEVQVDEEGNFDKEIDDDFWTVDAKGHFRLKKQAAKES